MAICIRSNFKKSSFDWKVKGLVFFLIFKRDWRATPPLTINSQHTSNQSFEIAILFSVVEESGNYVFENDNPLPFRTLSARVVNYAPRAYTDFYGKDGFINSGRGSLD